jgi:hypothetical protein
LPEGGLVVAIFVRNAWPLGLLLMNKHWVCHVCADVALCHAIYIRGLAAAQSHSCVRTHLGLSQAIYARGFAAHSAVRLCLTVESPHLFGGSAST